MFVEKLIPFEGKLQTFLVWVNVTLFISSLSCKSVCVLFHQVVIVTQLTVISTQTVDGFICRFLGLLKFNTIIDLFFISTVIYHESSSCTKVIFFCLNFPPKLK